MPELSLEHWNAAADLLQKGGAVMYVLLLLSVSSLAVILLKLLQFWRIGARRSGMMELIATGSTHEIRRRMALSRHPAARVVETALDTGHLPRELQEAEIERIGSVEIRTLETYIRSLEVVANLSPLIGLLGTVIGMIKAFGRLEEAGARVDPSQLAGGIWEALLTTAFGLIVAIPALGAVHYFERKIEGVRALMRDAAARVIASQSV
ncbi:MAG: MotA/TolQ/ExbB proton channel family protein [Rhodospirillales bacterium]|nr:MotA/TolQ/ExbB proton channel family protein [Rhodospirillales bacterium]MCY3854891.1 MotA/TolQ/ExbB proton channel family protein [Rhodospirillales bacterium]MCY4003683.1 MotA/TolQ/ExbB proton channel family protein [Rhodospirillales bacterium]MCY4096942.1 MotA/TolQ/ExbB proton channel family protein [Rhodospirillales bacterium]MDE0372916.1 MotA/TolQ/ExbB proton channel family protein [Rhodospirillales bacterium]